MADCPPALTIRPPLVNSSNPWATTLEDLRSLFACASTGAVTTRTSLLGGFAHDSSKHKYTFFDAAIHEPASIPGPSQNGSLNCLGYSPITLETYLGFVRSIANEHAAESSKGFIISVSGTPKEVAESYRLVAAAQGSIKLPLALEVNLSCPNIPDHPPPAYSEDALVEYLDCLQGVIAAHPGLPRVPFGLKTPPYTYSIQYDALISALERSAESAAGRVSPVSFITATNTLGSCLVISAAPSNSGVLDSSSLKPALPEPGIGGMGGAALRLCPTCRS